MSNIPENNLDVNKYISTNLNLGDNNNFQLLHNDVNDCYNFQVYGRFFGVKKDDIHFELQKIEFKLVHINVPKGLPHYKINCVSIKKNNELESNIDFDLFVDIQEVLEEHKGVDYTLMLKKDFIIKQDNLLDYHVSDNPNFKPLNRNGRPCKSKVYF